MPDVGLYRPALRTLKCNPSLVAGEQQALVTLGPGGQLDSGRYALALAKQVGMQKGPGEDAVPLEMLCARVILAFALL